MAFEYRPILMKNYSIGLYKVMRTLLEQKKRLTREIDSANERISALRAELTPDLSAIQQFNEAIERNRQLINMIDGHLQCAHVPMWRSK